MVKESRSIPSGWTYIQIFSIHRSGKGKPFFLQSDSGVTIDEETKELTHIGKNGGIFLCA
jgi:hypothetical protein